MALAMIDAVPGAMVEEYYDNEGKPLKTRRIGYITKTDYRGKSETYDSSGIDAVWVKFEKDSASERCPLIRFNLLKTATESSLVRLKRDISIEKADHVLGTFEKPIVVDRTGVDKRGRMSAEEARKL